MRACTWPVAMAVAWAAVQEHFELKFINKSWETLRNHKCISLRGTVPWVGWWKQWLQVPPLCFHSCVMHASKFIVMHVDINVALFTCSTHDHTCVYSWQCSFCSITSVLCVSCAEHAILGAWFSCYIPDALWCSQGWHWCGFDFWSMYDACCLSHLYVYVCVCMGRSL